MSGIYRLRIFVLIKIVWKRVRWCFLSYCEFDNINIDFTYRLRYLYSHSYSTRFFPYALHAWSGLKLGALVRLHLKWVRWFYIWFWSKFQIKDHHHRSSISTSSLQLLTLFHYELTPPRQSCRPQLMICILDVVELFYSLFLKFVPYYMWEYYNTLDISHSHILRLKKDKRIVADKINLSYQKKVQVNANRSIFQW